MRRCLMQQKAKTATHTTSAPTTDAPMAILAFLESPFHFCSADLTDDTLFEPSRLIALEELRGY